jgi:hypothetical protein
MGHKDIRTTQIYTHVLERCGNAVRSPLDCVDIDPNKRACHRKLNTEK